MKTFTYVFFSFLMVLVVICVFLLLRITPQRMNESVSIPSTPVSNPTWTNTPVPIDTSTPSPTNTPIPTATLPSQLKDWNELVASANYILRDDLLRYHKDHMNKVVYFEGIAQQVLGDEQMLVILLAVVEVDGDSIEYGGDVSLGYMDAPVRVIQDDWVEVVGRFRGIDTYQSVGAGPITIPLIEVIDLRIANE